MSYLCYMRRKPRTRKEMIEALKASGDKDIIHWIESLEREVQALRQAELEWQRYYG